MQKPLENLDCQYEGTREILDLADEARAFAGVWRPDDAKPKFNTLDEFLQWQANILKRTKEFLDHPYDRDCLEAKPENIVDVQPLIACPRLNRGFDWECCFAAAGTDAESGRRIWFFASHSHETERLPDLDSKTRAVLKRIANRENTCTDPLQRNFSILAFLEAFLESDAAVNDDDKAEDVIWAAHELLRYSQDFMQRVFFMALLKDNRHLHRERRRYKRLAALGATATVAAVGLHFCL